MAFSTRAREVLRKIQARRLLEHLAEIKCAGVHRSGDVGQGDFLGLILLDEFFWLW